MFALTHVIERDPPIEFYDLHSAWRNWPQKREDLANRGEVPALRGAGTIVLVGAQERLADDFGRGSGILLPPSLSATIAIDKGERDGGKAASTG